MSYGSDYRKAGTLLADEDLSAKQFFAVKLSADGEVALAITAGELTYGIIQNDPTSGKVCEVATDGIAKAAIGGTIDEGDPLTPDSAGKLVTAFGADRVCARALKAGSAGDIREVEVCASMGAFAQHGPHTKSFSLKLAKLADGDIVTTVTPGYAGRIKKFYAVVTDPATTASKASTLNIEIGATNLTGGSLALTSANMTPLGAVVAATAITAANTFTATDTFSVEAASTTAFIEGVIELVIEFA